MMYVGIYALIYLHTILHQGMDSRDGLPRGALPSGILKIEKYCPGHKVRSPTNIVYTKREQDRQYGLPCFCVYFVLITNRHFVHRKQLLWNGFPRYSYGDFIKPYLNSWIVIYRFYNISNLSCKIPTTYPLEGVLSTLITLLSKSFWNTIFMVWAFVSDHIFTLDHLFAKSACETIFVQGLALSWSWIQRTWIGVRRGVSAQLWTRR